MALSTFVHPLPMTTHSAQIQRIIDKLSKAKKADRDFVVFGSESHKYRIKKPATQAEITAFEQKCAVQLPDCYKAFMLQVGNGGIGYSGSSAGPFYGIYPLGKNVDELTFNQPERYLKNDCILYPDMTEEYWTSLTKTIDENDSISREDFETEIGKIFAGILPIGSQGCSLIHGIVLNGPYKGCVVNLDQERQKPHFTHENNFLDWYERWLDEIISGELIENSLSWFGYDKRNL